MIVTLLNSSVIEMWSEKLSSCQVRLLLLLIDTVNVSPQGLDVCIKLVPNSCSIQYSLPL